MLLPLKDSNPLNRISFQMITVGLIAACVIVFLWQLSLGDQGQRAVLGLGAIPGVLFGVSQLSPELVMVPTPVTLITSMFLHGGWMHLIGNMLFLWVFGDNIEDAMGHVRFIIFYVLCGIAAALTHAGLDPASTTPMIGASGAISGVIGAYLILHPKAQVLTLVFRFFIHLPAFVVLGVWILLQAFNAFSVDTGASGVAWWAHIGGFIAGCLLIIPMRHKNVPLFDGLWKQNMPPRTTRRSRIPDSGKKRR